MQHCLSLDAHAHRRSTIASTSVKNWNAGLVRFSCETTPRINRFESKSKCHGKRAFSSKVLELYRDIISFYKRRESGNPNWLRVLHRAIFISREMMKETLSQRFVAAVFFLFFLSTSSLERVSREKANETTTGKWRERRWSFRRRI
jgi:hypothetical protein